MKRATITIPDELEDALERWLGTQSARPSLTAVVQAALRSYLGSKLAPESRQDSASRYRVVDEAGVVAEPAAEYGRRQVSIPGGLWEHARLRAEQEGMTMDELCERLLVQELEDSGAERPWMRLAGAVDIDDPYASATVDDVVYGREQP